MPAKSHPAADVYILTEKKIQLFTLKTTPSKPNQIQTRFLVLPWVKRTEYFRETTGKYCKIFQENSISEEAQDL